MTVEAQSWPGKGSAAQAAGGSDSRLWLGPRAYLFLLVWTLSLVLFLPPERTLPGAALALVAWLTCRRIGPAPGRSSPPPGARRPSWRRYRWLFFAGLITLPTFLSAITLGPGWQPQIVSWAPVAEALRVSGRALVIMVAVNHFASAVSIGEIAAFFERAGVHGLGFALGVAFNLLPILQQTIRSTWNSMRMRGGFRRQRLHHLRLYLTTVLYTTLRRAEAIALAAESRAYSPDKSHPAPLPRGNLDIFLVVTGSGAFLLLFFL